MVHNDECDCMRRLQNCICAGVGLSFSFFSFSDPDESVHKNALIKITQTLCCLLNVSVFSACICQYSKYCEYCVRKQLDKRGYLMSKALFFSAGECRQSLEWQKWIKFCLFRVRQSTFLNFFIALRASWHRFCDLSKLLEPVMTAFFF